LANKIGD